MKIAPTPPNSSLFRTNFPFSPAKFPVFYGWAILVASVLGVLTSIPRQPIGVSVFTDHLIAATGLSRLDLANAYLVGTLTSGCLLPFGGKLLDRLGARRVVVQAAVGLGVTLAYLALCDRTVTFLSAWLPLSPTAIANLDIAWMLIPAVVGLGISGGCFGTLTTVVLPRFFGRAHLGAIAGVQMMLVVIASAIGPSLLANFKAITGSYSGGLYACCLFAPVVIVLMLFVRSPAEIEAKAQS